MGSQFKEEGLLYASLCEVERGLFHVAYRMDGKGLGHHHLPHYEVATCASEARSRIEQQALACGYALVVWHEDQEEPPILIPLKEPDTRLSH